MLHHALLRRWCRVLEVSCNKAGFKRFQVLLILLPSLNMLS
jgi:hypothetical protein